MENKLIIRKSDYYVEREEYTQESKLKLDFMKTCFSTYDATREYLHIQVGDYDDFNLFLEIDAHRAEEMFLELAEKARKVKRGY